MNLIITNPGRPRFQDEDGSPTGFPGTIKFTPSGQVTDNADGSYTIDIAGAGFDPDTIWKSPAIIRRDLSTPPGAPGDGDRYIINAGVAGDWYSDGGTWKYRQAITINPGSDKVPSSLSNFPVTIVIDSAVNHVFGNANSTGYDILFTSSDKLTKLDHELEHYDETVGSKYAECHVRIPTLGTGTTVIYMYYGNAAVGADPSLAATWDANHLFVQHLSDLTTSTTKDSVTAANNMSKGVANNPLEVDAKVGKGQSCDGINDYIKTANNFLSGPAAITVSAWIKKEAGGSTYECAVHKAIGTTIGNSDYWLGVDINDFLTVTIGANQGGIGWAKGQTTTKAVYGTWYHLAATWDGTDVVVYLNGAFNKTYALGTYGDNNTDTRIGASSDGTTYQFKGEVDEVRISDAARSADWIETQYNNQDSPSDFLTFADAEAPSATGDWAGFEEYITEYDLGITTWVMDGPPVIGWTVWDTNEAELATYNGSGWVGDDEVQISHNQTTNKQGGDTDEYFHMTESEHAAATRIATNALSGLMPPNKLDSWDSAWHQGNILTQELQFEYGTPSFRFHDTSDDSAYRLVHDADDGTYPGLALYVGSVSE